MERQLLPLLPLSVRAIWISASVLWGRGSNYHSHLLDGKILCVTQGVPWTRNCFRNRTRRNGNVLMAYRVCRSPKVHCPVGM